MSENTRKKMVYGVLVVAIIWGIINNPFAEQTPHQFANSTDSAQWLPEDSVAEPVEVAGVARSDSLLRWKHDPFIRPQKAKIVQAESFGLALSAISIANGKSMAMINGKIVGSGEIIDGWAVVDIQEQSVFLKKGSRNKELKLKRR